ncbi:MAG: glycerol-3-phosphate 1-O-acyltransferase PlsY [Armatimonadetes bacterium]|nr:glycerol-3-phosphate 1-O-acyltransferase PlsY [Akkermansiaceae bacterium]
MQLWICPLIAFLVGSIPFGLLIAKSQGIDIRQHGSGNIGATNVFRIVGKKYGLLCLLLDALKGFIPVVIALNLVRIEGNAPAFPMSFLEPTAERFTVQLVHVITALAAILGHNYSPWIRFKGGKGIATSAGVLIALMPAAVVILILVFVVTLIITRYVAIASIAAAISLPIITHLGARFHGRWDNGTWNIPLFFFSLLIGILAIWRHRSNIIRLRDGTEDKFVWGAKPEQPTP